MTPKGPAGLDGHSELVPMMWTSSIFAIGLLVLTFLYKIAITVHEQTVGVEIDH